MKMILTIYFISAVGSLLCSLYMQYLKEDKLNSKDLILAFIPIANFILTFCLIMCMLCDITNFFIKIYKKIKKGK